MTRASDREDTELVALVRARSRPSDEAEVRAALGSLGEAEVSALRDALRAAPGTTALGPFAWADVARGVSREVAQAREIGGYYALKAERDALAALVRGGAGASSSAPSPPRKAPARASAPALRRTRAMRRTAEADRRARELLGLFAYHRDAPLVARALGISLAELTEELDVLKIRRKAFRIARGSGHDLLAAAPVSPAVSGPPLRRRAKSVAQKSEEPRPRPPSAREAQLGELKAVLAELGAKRTLLASRLANGGERLSDAALLARFRAAGLEREFALRERDLIRALWAKHRGSESRVAAELSTDSAGLRRLLLERGLARELDAQRDRLRRDARRRKWPRERIEQVLHRRDELRELGLLDELETEVRARAGVIWKTLHGKPDALELFAKKLRLTRADASRLRGLLDLR